MSALDVSVQAQVVNLLDDLQDDLGLSYIFVAHDLSVVRHVSDRIAVMYLGKIVELSAADTLYAQPKHPYTASLLEAIPIPDPDRVRRDRSNIAAGRAAQPDQPAVGLPVPHPLPLRHRDLPRRSSRRWRSTPTGTWPPATTRSTSTPAELAQAVRVRLEPARRPGAELTPAAHRGRHRRLSCRGQ